jgi:hypothetical protein
LVYEINESCISINKVDLCLINPSINSRKYSSSINAILTNNGLARQAKRGELGSYGISSDEDLIAMSSRKGVDGDGKEKP